MIGLTVATRGYSGADGSGLTLATYGYVRQISTVIADAAIPVDITSHAAEEFSVPVSIANIACRDAQLALDYLNNSLLVLGDHVSPLSWTAEVAWSPAIMLDVRAQIARDVQPVAEYLQSSASSVTTPVISDKNISSSHEQPYVWSGWLRADKSLDVDFVSYLLVDRFMSVEALKSIALSQSIDTAWIKSIISKHKIPVSVTGGWGQMVFLHPRGTVHFYRRPVKPGMAKRNMLQQQDWDSDGARYAYDKSPVVRAGEDLEFQNMDSYTLSVLLYFFEQATRGMKDTFTWFDWNGNEHTARFSSPKVEWKQAGPDQYSVKFSLIEDIAL